MLDDDSLLTEYLTESREHLATIETDLLDMEAAGANMDEVLVNKVFRAAHSVKGGAGFFGLNKLQELAHKIENILEMIRSSEMVPTPEAINILLLAFDKLREMINSHTRSNETDITELVVSLTGLASTNLPQEQKASLVNEVELQNGQGRGLIKMSEFDLAHARKGGKLIYLVVYDLIDDIQRMGTTPLEVFRMMESCGVILDCRINLASVGTLEDEPSSAVPLEVLYATVMERPMVESLLKISEEKINLIEDDQGQHIQDEAHDQKTAKTSTAKKKQKAKGKTEAKDMRAPDAPAPVNSAPQEKTPQEAAPRATPPAASPQAAPAMTSASAGTSSDTTLRVNVNLLEYLMNLAGEMVLSRNQLVEAIARKDEHSIQVSGQRINMVTSELQEAIMMTRMQPIGNVLNKFPRVVRDMSKELGKEISLNITGKDVEMDKTIIEALSDPLTHMIRNAVDHGIENQSERLRQGKNPAGSIQIKAYHEAGQVVIEISDDGKGLNAERIAQSAADKGLISAEQVKTLPDKEKCALIFLPGLSTAEKVTDLSGRGVGMDVVKTNLDKLGGKVYIDSAPGKGTTFHIKLPLTLAIIPSLLVSLAEERFAIPQINVVELLRITADQVKKRIEIIGDAEVLNLRGQLIPVVHLADVLGITRTYIDENGERLEDRRSRISDRRSPVHSPDKPLLPSQGPAGDMLQRQGGDRRYHAASDLNIVVVSAGALQYGLVVENLHDTVEIVVKPLGRHIKHLREYAGTTIMGDGRVALILDVAGLAAMKGLASLGESTRARELQEQSLQEKFQDTHSFLTFHNAPDEVCAVPLELIARIEQIEHSQVEIIGGKRTMQYRGASLPLVTLKDAADVKEIAPEQELAVLVFEAAGREFGLLAAMPVDVIETSAIIDQNTLRQPGVMGSTILKGDTSLILDIHELVETVYPDLMSGNNRAKRPLPSGETPVILLAEDSEFFRNQVMKFIERGGYLVMPAVDGQQAWELLQNNVEHIKAVVTDIEMPRLNGLGLTQNIRHDERFAGLPIIALTSLASEDDIARGKAAGINDYQVKLDKERLLESLQKYLHQETIAQ